MNKTKVIRTFTVIIISLYIGYLVGCIHTEWKYKNYLNRLEYKLNILEMKL